MTKRFPTLASAAVAVSLVVAGCGSDTTGEAEAGVTEETIHIGITNALTGPGGSVCSPFTEAASAYFEVVNEEGGVKGRQIEYEVLDDAYDSSRAIANMRKLMGEDIFAFVGGCGTIQAAALGPALTKAEIPYLFPYAGLRELFEPTSPYVYGLMPLYEDQIKALIPHAFQEKGAGSVFMASNEWPGYDDAIENTKKSAEDGGGTFLGSQVTKLGTADYTPLALEIRSKRPDYVVINQGGADAVKLVDALVAQRALPKKGILGVSTLTTGVFLTTHDVEADPLLYIASPVNVPAAEDSTCTKALESAGLGQDGATVFGCAQAQLFVEALESAESITRPDLLKALDEMSLPEDSTSVLPEVSFSADDHMGEDTVFIQTIDGTSLTTVTTANVE